MRKPLLVITISIAIIFPFILTYLFQANAAEKSKVPSISIDSDKFELDLQKNIITITGNVEAKSDDFTIKSNKMVVYLNNKPGQDKSQTDDMQFEKILATGNVKIIRPGSGDAMADQAIYYQVDEKVVLTGNPVVKQGQYNIEGAKIILLLKEKRHIIEGSKSKRVKVTHRP